MVLLKNDERNVILTVSC